MIRGRKYDNFCPEVRIVLLRDKSLRSTNQNTRTLNQIYSEYAGACNRANSYTGIIRPKGQHKFQVTCFGSRISSSGAWVHAFRTFFSLVLRPVNCRHRFINIMLYFNTQCDTIINILDKTRCGRVPKKCASVTGMSQFLNGLRKGEN